VVFACFSSLPAVAASRIFSYDAVPLPSAEVRQRLLAAAPDDERHGRQRVEEDDVDG